MRKLILGLVVLLSLAAAGGWFAWVQLGDPHYRSKAMIQLYGQPVSGSPLAHAAEPTPVTLEDVSVAAMMREVRNQAILIRKDDLLRQTIQWPSVKNTDWWAGFDGDVQHASAELARRVRAHPVPDSTLIQVSVDMEAPSEASTVLDALITVYLHQRQTDAEALTAGWQTSLIRERERAVEEQRRLQMERDRFITENDLAGDEPTGPSLRWIEQRLVEAELTLSLLAEASDEPDQPNIAAEIAEAKKVVDYWQSRREQTHGRARDESQKRNMLENLDAAAQRLQHQQDAITARLADLRLSSTAPGFARTARAAAPTEAQRVGWRWPWD